MNRTIHSGAVALLALLLVSSFGALTLAEDGTGAEPDDQITVVEIDNSTSCMRYFPSFGKALRVPCNSEPHKPVVKEAHRPPVDIEKVTLEPVEEVEELEDIQVDAEPINEASVEDDKASEESFVPLNHEALPRRAPPAAMAKPAPQKKRVKPRKTYRKKTAHFRSCGGCRNSCYVRYRVRSYSRRFVPCMQQCWYRSCR